MLEDGIRSNLNLSRSVDGAAYRTGGGQGP